MKKLMVTTLIFLSAVASAQVNYDAKPFKITKGYLTVTLDSADFEAKGDSKVKSVSLCEGEFDVPNFKADGNEPLGFRNVSAFTVKCPAKIKGLDTVILVKPFAIASATLVAPENVSMSPALRQKAPAWLNDLFSKGSQSSTTYGVIMSIVHKSVANYDYDSNVSLSPEQSANSMKVYDIFKDSSAYDSQSVTVMGKSSAGYVLATSLTPSTSYGQENISEGYSTGFTINANIVFKGE